MSNSLIRKALETRLAAMPNVPTIVYENSNVSVGTGPYVSTNILFSEPDDVGFKDSSFIQRGYLQLTLYYPTNSGPGAAERMAENFRLWFARSFSFSVEGATVIVERTPEITNGGVEDSRFVIRVFVRFRATMETSLSGVGEVPVPIVNEW